MDATAAQGNVCKRAPDDGSGGRGVGVNGRRRVGLQVVTC